MNVGRRIGRLERLHRATPSCRVCNGEGRWVAEYENDRFAPPKPPDHAQGCPGCGKRNVIAVAYVETQIRKTGD